jgi:hypothetical protein
MVSSAFTQDYCSLSSRPSITMHYTYECVWLGVRYRYVVHASLDKTLESLKKSNPAEVALWVRSSTDLSSAVTTQTLAHIYLLFVPHSADVERDFKCVVFILVLRSCCLYCFCAYL